MRHAGPDFRDGEGEPSVCGIAGYIDLADERQAPAGLVERMASAIYHRGPDEDGFYRRGGLSLANRRLSIVGLADGRQPIANETGEVSVVFNGELFDYPERKAELQGQGHTFRTGTDTELFPHLWEQHGIGMFEKIRGQFAFCLVDQRSREVVIARDRFGICPLYYTFQKDGDGRPVLLFASEVKALLASGVVPAAADRQGLNHIFTFFAMPGPVTCFAGVRALLPGQYLHFKLGANTRPEGIAPKFYWQIDFPDRGDEDPGDERRTPDDFEAVFMAAVQRRLRADVPVVSYLSGGVDSSAVVAMASKALGRPIPTFTVGVQAAGMNETEEAGIVARHIGAKPFVVPFDGGDVLRNYPQLVRTAEMPVVDTACAAMLELARAVHGQGFKVALTGEGSDEWLGGYPWFKIYRLFSLLDTIPGLTLSQTVRRAASRALGLPLYPMREVRRMWAALGGTNPWLDVYGLMSMSKLTFYSAPMREAVGNHLPYEDLQLPLERMRKWHPYNRGLALGGRVMLPGMLLLSKGDRVAMHSSVETRYPFLDEEVFAFLAKLHPRWKMRGLKDKYVLRTVAERWVPKQIAWRTKAMFRAPMDSFHLAASPPYVEQLLSAESLRKTGYFDPTAVAHWRHRLPGLKPGSYKRTAIEMGLMGVTSTQLWHQQFVDAGIADVPATVNSPTLRQAG